MFQSWALVLQTDPRVENPGESQKKLGPLRFFLCACAFSYSSKTIVKAMSSQTTEEQKKKLHLLLSNSSMEGELSLEPEHFTVAAFGNRWERLDAKSKQMFFAKVFVKREVSLRDYWDAVLYGSSWRSQDALHLSSVFSVLYIHALVAVPTTSPIR